MFGFASHQVCDGEGEGEGEGENAVEHVDTDLLIGPVMHRGERDDVLVFHLSEPGLDLALGTVGCHDLGGGLGVAVGEQDPFAEKTLFESLPGPAVDTPSQAESGGIVSGQGSGENLADPAGPADAVDPGLEMGAVAAGTPASELLLQLAELASGLGQRLIESTGLLGVQVRRVGQRRPPGDADGAAVVSTQLKPG